MIERRSQNAIDTQYRTDLDRDIAEVMRCYAVLSERAREELPCQVGLAYGSTRDEKLDLFPAQAGAPVMMFVHGGYWRLGSAADVSMLARGPLAHGIAVAIIDYALCPSVTIDDITRQTRAAFAWLWREADSLGIDRNRMLIAGHSAGGQQVGMLLATDWAADYGLPADVVKGAIAVSGIFDLRPLRHSWLQPVLQLTADVIRRQSPLFHVPERGPPLIVTCGGAESTEFHRQSHEYLSAWKERGLPGEFMDQPGADHFAAIESLAQPDAFLTRALKKLSDALPVH